MDDINPGLLVYYSSHGASSNRVAMQFLCKLSLPLIGGGTHTSGAASEGQHLVLPVVWCGQARNDAFPSPLVQTYQLGHNRNCPFETFPSEMAPEVGVRPYPIASSSQDSFGLPSRREMMGSSLCGPHTAEEPLCTCASPSQVHETVLNGSGCRRAKLNHIRF